jgi:parvulin-like peptidyl-prolyl isomerase
VDRAKLDPSVVKVMLALKPEQVSDIIRLDNAFTIVRLNKHIMPGKTKLEDVRDALRKDMQKEKVERLRQAFDKKLHQNAKVEIL